MANFEDQLDELNTKIFDEQISESADRILEEDFQELLISAFDTDSELSLGTAGMDISTNRRNYNWRAEQLFKVVSSINVNSSNPKHFEDLGELVNLWARAQAEYQAEQEYSYD